MESMVIRSAHTEIISLPERLIEPISKDYAIVARIVAELGNQFKVPQLATESVKPFTMLNLAIANELNVPKDKRIACASVVDVAARAVGISDDVIDGEIVELDNALDAGYTNLSFKGKLIIEHIKKNLISLDQADQLYNILLTQKCVMKEGISWQSCEGKLTTKDIHFEEFLELYVDKIAGGLFHWALEPISCYYPEIEGDISELLKVVANFSRIFQIKDDIIDIIHDYKKDQLTTALFFLRDIKSEMNRLRNWNPDILMSEKLFQRAFPETYRKLDSIIKREEEIMLRNLQTSSIPMTYYDLIQLNRVYKELRGELNNRLSPLWAGMKI